MTKNPAVARFQELNVKGVLMKMAEAGQIFRVQCEMPKCYHPDGRNQFDRKESEGPLDWQVTPDHYPQLKADGGHLDPWNVRIAHLLCNREDHGWRMRIRRMIEKGMSLEDIAAKLNQKGIKTPTGTPEWTSHAVRRAFVS